VIVIFAGFLHCQLAMLAAELHNSASKSAVLRVVYGLAR
jgi:hypothetical protein